MSIKRSLVALATLAVLSLPTTAFAADSTGQKGSIETLEINHSTSDTYLQYHGRIVIKTGKSTTTEYRWGGTSCSNKTLPSEIIDLLWEAFRTRKSTQITPRFQSGQGSNKCLVGFTFGKTNDTSDDGDDDKDPPTAS
ncbi:hypothetical protein ACNOYE_32780 [Nannocystaceae bacterium ST9]